MASYRELAPPADLAAVVACVWTSVSRGGVVLPDGCVDLVASGDRVIVAGPATGPVAVDVPAGTRVCGVRFRLGTAGAALGLPASELRDLDVPLAEVWGAAAANRVAAAWRAPAEAGVPAELRGLVGLVRERLRGVALDPLARAAAVRMAAPGARVAALGDELGVSERQLRRRFEAAVGYGPKTFARVLRFQRFLALAAGGGDLARLALAAGYADQAHLTRETRRLAGRTPAELVAARPAPAGERLPGAR